MQVFEPFLQVFFNSKTWSQMHFFTAKLTEKLKVKMLKCFLKIIYMKS